MRIRGDSGVEAVLTGRPAPSASRLPLHAGPLKLELDGVDVRRIAYGDAEVAQQVYVAVRDVGWGAFPPTHTDVRVDEGPGPSFKVELDSRHAYPLERVDLSWRGWLTGTVEGVISLTIEVSTAQPLVYNRIGLNILHGARTYARRPYRAWLGDRLIAGRMPDGVGSQRWVGERLAGLFAPFDLLELSPRDGLVVRFELEGDEFEIEDQRNFGDATFKTYSTPLQRPGPFHLEPGQRIRQSVTIRAEDERSPRAARGSRRGDDRPLVLTLGGTTGRAMPPIGLGQASDDLPLSSGERERVSFLRPDHLRVELAAADELVVARRRLANAALEARALGTALWVDLTMSEPRRAELADLVSAALAVDPVPARLFVATPETEASVGDGSLRMLAEARELVRRAGASSAVGRGAVMSFAELNREPFDGAIVESLAFPLSPTVHRADDSTLLENIDRLGDAVTAARGSLGDRPLLVGPITLATRHGPYPAGPSGPEGLPARVDPRQVSLLAAVWTTGCLAELAGAGVEGLTFYETAGPLGVTERDAGSPHPTRFLSRPGQVYPLWHVLADAGEWRGARILSVGRATEPAATPDVACLAVESRGAGSLLIASLAREPRAVRVLGLGSERVRVRPLDVRTALAATTDPAGYRSTAWEPRSVRGGGLDLALGSYAVLRVDLG